MNLNRTIAPEIQTLEGIDFRLPEPVMLDNGWEVYCMDVGDQDVIRIDWIFDAGSWQQEKALSAFSTVRMLPEGTTNRNSKEIFETLQYHGAYIDTQNNHHTASITLYALNKHLNALLPLLSEIISSPSFPADELNVFLNKTRHDLRVNLEKVNFLAKRHFTGLLFGHDHPYGRSMSEEDIDAIHREDLNGFYGKYFAGSPRIILAGKLPGDIIRSLNNSFSGSGRGYYANGETERQFNPFEPARTHITRHGALQTAIRIGRPLFTMNHPDFHGFSILNTILGGYFGSRLMNNLREDKGYTYGINSGLMSMRKHGYFFISSQVGAEHMENSLREIRIELDKLCNELVPEKELELVRNYSLGSLARAYDGAFARAERLKTSLDLGLDAGFLDMRTSVIREITANEIRELARKYLDISNMLELTVGP